MKSDKFNCLNKVWIEIAKSKMQRNDGSKNNSYEWIESDGRNSNNDQINQSISLNFFTSNMQGFQSTWSAAHRIYEIAKKEKKIWNEKEWRLTIDAAVAAERLQFKSHRKFNERQRLKTCPA